MNKKIILIVLAIVIVVGGGIFAFVKLSDKEKIANFNDLTSISYNDKISFKIENKKFVYKNMESGNGSSINFDNKAKYLAIGKACDVEEKYQVYVLTDDGQLFINRYPSFKYDEEKKLNMGIEFLYVISDKKIVGLETVQTSTKECESSEVYAVLENKEKHKIKIEYGQTSYSSKSHLALAAFLGDKVAEK